MEPLPCPTNQINISFNPLEDRLLLRLASQKDDCPIEYRLWLTRRYVKLLLPVLDKMLESEEKILTQVFERDRKTVLEFQKQAALSQTDFKTPYSDEAKETPLGSEPLLVSRIHAGKSQNGRPVLSLKTGDNKGISLGMDSRMIHSMKQLLIQGIRKAEWDILPDLMDQNKQNIKTPQQLI